GTASILVVNLPPSLRSYPPRLKVPSLFPRVRIKGKLIRRSLKTKGLSGEEDMIVMKAAGSPPEWRLSRPVWRRSDVHLIEFSPFYVIVEHDQVAAGRDAAGIQVRAAMGFCPVSPASKNPPEVRTFRVSVGSIGKCAVRCDDPLARTGILQRAVRHLPRRGVEGLGNIGRRNTPRSLKRNGVANHAVARRIVGRDFI